MCGCRPRPWDLDLHPTNKGQNTRKRDIEGQRAIEAHGTSNQHIDLSTQTWHRAHKHMDLNISMTRGLKRHRSKHRYEDLSINMAKKAWACRSKHTKMA